MPRVKGETRKKWRSQAPQGRLFLGEAKRTLEAWDPFCWVGAFSSGEHAAPTPTPSFGRQGVRCAGAKKIILAGRALRLLLRYFSRPAP